MNEEPKDEVIVDPNDPMITTTKHADGSQSVTIGVERMEASVNMDVSNGQEKLVVPPQKCFRCGSVSGFVFGVRKDSGHEGEMWLVCTGCGNPIKSIDALRLEAAKLKEQQGS